jgi:hypothetical protein
MRGHVEEMLSDLRAAADLDESTRKLLLDHLHALAWALDDLKFGGPGAVIAATERLVGAVALQVREEERKGFVGRAVALVVGVWSVFKAGPEAQQALEAWTEMGGEALRALH